MVRLPGFRRSPSDTSDADKPAKELDHYAVADVKRATRTRRVWSTIAAVCLFITVIFLLVVEVGNTHNVPGLRNIWFIRLNVSNIVPLSFGPQAALLNSIARTLGLHDFYQVGLWNYCEGYVNEGVTNCSKPQTLYWFDPVSIITSELLVGASIQLPPSLSNILDIIETASHWMFALFMTGICFSFVGVFLMPLSVSSRWVAFAMTIVTFLNGIVVVAATVIATVMFIIMRNVFRDNSDVNIVADIGVTMFALMWVASAFAIIAFVIQICLMCCCTSKRDVRRQRGRFRAKA